MCKISPPHEQLPLLLQLRCVGLLGYFAITRPFGSPVTDGKQEDF